MNSTSERANNAIPNHSTANHQQYFAHPPTQIHHQRVASGQGEQRMSNGMSQGLNSAMAHVARESSGGTIIAS